jgi:hypothetical protein
MNHLPHLLGLLQNHLEVGCDTLKQGQLFWGYLTNWIPEPAAPEIFKENNMKYSGREKEFLYRSYYKLREDPQTEYLEDRELNRRLSSLVTKVIENRNEFLNTSTLKNEINQFIAEIIKPLETYEVMFKILNMKADLDEITFWDCKIAKYDAEALHAWGFEEGKEYLLDIENFTDKNVIIVDEKGNNRAEVVKRARSKANQRIKALQCYLKVEFIYDVQLMFEISTDYAVRRYNISEVISTGFDNRNSPIHYDYPDSIIEQVEKANKDYLLIQTFPPKIVDLLERTLYWIGLSISELEFDVKITYLCTALETLLTTKSDKRKGEKIAYRGYLLAMETRPDENHYQIQKSLFLYEKRSSVVHGSRFGISTEKDYWFLLDFTKYCFDNFIVFAKKHNLNRQSRIYKKLLESDNIDPLLSWLEEAFDDEYSKNIGESIQEDLQGS